jgi:hypothetical protein
MMPASWGLSGKSRKIAEAEYYYSGYELDNELLLIEHDNKDGYELQKEFLKLDHKWNKLSEEELEYSLLQLALDHDEMTQEEHDVAKLELDIKYNKIAQQDYLRKKADILKEPYVNVLSMDIDDEIPTQGSFELDWNDEFIKMLHAAGITGTSDEDVVNKWFNSVCRTVLLQSSVDQDYGLSQQQPQGREDVLRKIDPRRKD